VSHARHRYLRNINGRKSRLGRVRVSTENARGKRGRNRRMSRAPEGAGTAAGRSLPAPFPTRAPQESSWPGAPRHGLSLALEGMHSALVRDRMGPALGCGPALTTPARRESCQAPASPRDRRGRTWDSSAVLSGSRHGGAEAGSRRACPRGSRRSMKRASSGRKSALTRVVLPVPRGPNRK